MKAKQVGGGGEGVAVKEEAKTTDAVEAKLQDLKV
jgi:hypothetical protein